MKALFEGIFGKRAAPATSVGEPASDALPTAGSIFSFRTSPFSDFAPPETGRYAAFKILAADDSIIVLAVLDGIWDAPPTLGQTDRLPILCEHRFACTGRPAVFGVQAAWWVPANLLDLRLVGSVRVDGEEAKLADVITNHRVGARHATLHAASYCAEGEWRWAHDREAVAEENEKRDAHNAAVRAAQDDRYRNRLSKLTWDQLLLETPFERWSPSPPFPPVEFTKAARKAIHDACQSLKAMGPKRRKAEVRAVLKACVIWFNDADEKAGGVIETEEREDICAVLEEMAFVARQKSLVDEIEQWRSW